MREKNLCSKMRGINDPYEIWKTPNGDWEWRVLKKWQTPKGEASNPYARWFCAVKSPFTYNSYDMGDVYVNDITKYGIKVTEQGGVK